MKTAEVFHYLHYHVLTWYQPKLILSLTLPLLTMDDDANAAAVAMAAVIMACLPPPAAPSMASALMTINVKTHIPFALEIDPPNYSTRRELFLTLVSKFGALSHIDSTPVLEEPDAT